MSERERKEEGEAGKERIRESEGRDWVRKEVRNSYVFTMFLVLNCLVLIFLECVAGINFRMSVYLQKNMKLIR